MGKRSLPVWGEWIEILPLLLICDFCKVSLPVWGEWIEICAFSAPLLRGQSLPVWGEWIEIWL